MSGLHPNLAIHEAAGVGEETGDLRILVLAPTSNDAQLTARFLENAGLATQVCTTLALLAQHLHAGCGALLLAEEALAEATLNDLVHELELQPSWSDLPVILITGAGESGRVRPRYLAALGPAGNVSIIERPVRPETLVSTCEVALRARRRQYQVRDLLAQRDAVLASISDAFVTLDHEWRYTFLNAKAEAISGQPRAAIFGQSFWDVFPGLRESSFRDAMLSAKAEGRDLEFEYFHQKTRRWLGVRLYPSAAGVSIFTTDITERREAQEQVRESKARLHFALESAQIGDWDLNLETDSAYRSLRHDQAFGYSQPVTEWGFQTFIQHVHPDDRERVSVAFQKALAEKDDWKIECRVIWPDQSVHWILVHGSLYRDAAGNSKRMLGLVMDITARKHAEEALIAQADALQEADRRKDEFLAMLAHELRNPLAAVANAVAVLKAGDAHDRDWATGVVERQSAQLVHLIDDLLDVSRITTGKIRLRKQVVDVAAILERASDSARPLLEERDHRLITSFEPGRLWLEADPTRIEQIVLNLLTNAAKYTPANGRIELSAVRNGHEICITVADDGIGIAPERLPEMFQLFAQGERSIARSEGGLGIGLTIVQKLVDLHGGRVEAHSDGPNLGSRFTVCFPSVAAPALNATTKPAKPDATRSPLRVLIVDDNMDTAQGMARLLSRLGHRTDLAHDGFQALERARDLKPDTVVLDIGLPGMDGFEVARRLRSEPDCHDALIIALTGYGQPEDRQRALAAGCDRHLVKPVDFQELLQVFRERRRDP